MFASPQQRMEIDHRTIKLLIGGIAVTLATLTSYFTGHQITSISASYYETGWGQTIFIGFLFAIAAFMLAYNGNSTLEKVLSKLASVAALGVAMFPCACGKQIPLVPYVHGASAAVMFSILAIFCAIFYKRANQKGFTEARRRAYIYAVCGWVIVGCIAVLTADNFLGGVIEQRVARLVFYGENAGLVAFGISWLTASKWLPVISRQDERLVLLAP